MPEPIPTPRTLFFQFFLIGISGFGGVLPMAKAALVDRLRWLTLAEFAEYLSLGQVIPGPNIVNLSIALGGRYAGVRGALAAIGGLMLPPMAVVILLALLYQHFADVPSLQHALRGMAAVAAGLVLALGGRMLMRLPRRAWPAGVFLLVFTLLALWRWPLPLVMLCAVPLALLLAWRDAR